MRVRVCVCRPVCVRVCVCVCFEGVGVMEATHRIELFPFQGLIKYYCRERERGTRCEQFVLSYSSCFLFIEF